MSPRRLTALALTVLSATAALAAAPGATAAGGGAPLPMPLPMPLPLFGEAFPQPPAVDAPPADRVPPAGTDQLTVVVDRTGDPHRDGTYHLDCHPTTGTHRDPQGACDRLDEVATWGRDPFAPVPPDAMCTRIYGGPAVAHVVGTWAGRPVDARFSRTDGCEIRRWDHLRPLLPDLSS
ncbi:SSI family serine proteinase inhibitor [Streptomyces sp. URMC 123]|uniref:SSI family serine proteinase inhibitor n=1 Tax=Streptomyces sp. URMC 123 TaxID=3423403 RepID=UPI003F1C9EDA